MTSPIRALQDTSVLTGRMLRHNVRSMDTIMTVVGMPLMILLAFVFVLGGAMDIPGVRYVDYIVPVTLLVCIASGVAYTAFRVTQDVTEGIFARFRTMPIARSSLIGGHVVASLLVNAISVVILYAIALLIGYRPKATTTGWLISIGMLILVLLAFTLMGVAFGLIAKTAEGSGMFSYIVIALLFVSSGFAPTATMPSGLSVFATYQPMTPIIDTIRKAQLGQSVGSEGWVGFAWCVGLIALFAILALVFDKKRAQTRP